MDATNQENINAEALTSQHETSAEEIKFLKFQLQQRQEKIDELHTHIGERVTEAAAMMTAWRWSITTQITAYNAANEANGNLFPAFSTGIQFADLKSFIVDWESDNRYSFDDMIEENVSAKLEVDTDWGEESCRIEIVKSVDSGDILPDIISSLIESLEGQFNG
jgi:hypothetical protein